MAAGVLGPACARGNRMTEISSLTNRSGLGATCAAISTALESSQRFVLTTHRDPDGDGLGAESALVQAFYQLGKEVRVINNDPVPAQYRFLHGSDRFRTYRARSDRALIQAADVLLLVDAARPERTGRLAPLVAGFGGTTIAIDHHQDRGWAQLDLVEPAACATTELAHELLTRPC
jgi:phosphoesterase RecJ-like protein